MILKIEPFTPRLIPHACTCELPSSLISAVLSQCCRDSAGLDFEIQNRMPADRATIPPSVAASTSGVCRNIAIDIPSDRQHRFHEETLAINFPCHST